MTPADLAHLKALCDAATPGEWRVEQGTTLVWGHSNEDRLGVPLVNAVTAHRSWGIPVDIDERLANAAFLAASRTAVPQLLDEIEQLTSGVREMTLHAGNLQAEVERLTALAKEHGDNWQTANEWRIKQIARAEKAEALLRCLVACEENDRTSPDGTVGPVTDSNWRQALKDVHAHLAEQEKTP